VIAVSVTTRNSTPADEPLLFELFAEHKVREFALLGLGDAQLRMLLAMQYRARCSGYAASFPSAVQQIVEEGGHAVGQLLVAEDEDALRVVDICIAGPQRRRGIGAAVLELVQETAGNRGKTVRLQVAPESPARRLYERLGFAVTASDETAVEMEWRPGRKPVQNDSSLRGIARLAVLATTCILAAAAHGQGVLTLTPGRSAGTIAGTGNVGYTGDNAQAAAATLAAPSAVAYDVSGNLFVADSNNHAVREIVKSSGNIITVAGTGVAGFSGDGGAATSAQLDTPTGLAVDKNNNLFIADSHNHRIRMVSGGTISTVAGNGVAGFGGDGGAATAAALDLPTGIAVDGNGNLYIADTNNQRIRKVTGTTISTIAGTGEQNYSGDGAAATAATLDSPTGVAVDATGSVYVADRHNQRVRLIAANGTISTLAGSGAPSLAGAFGGDGAAATAASLSAPTGVSVDAAGNVYIADTNNHRIRQVAGGAIATVEGNGSQGFAGDGAAATSASLDTPRAAIADGSGNLAVADTLNARVRSGGQPSLSLASAAVGIASVSQPITLSDTGNGPITVAAVSFTGPFTLAAGGTCSAAPITLAAGASCVQNIAFLPAVTGAASGSVTFSGAGVVTQGVLLTGTATKAATVTVLTSSVAAPFVNQPVTFTATVQPAGLGTPTGNVTFSSNGSSLGTVALVNRVAAFTTSFAAGGSYSISAVYGGDTNFNGSTAAPLSQPVGDFNFTLTGPVGSASQTVIPGQSATFNFNLAPLSGPFSIPIVLSATGTPPGSTVTFTPPTLTLGSTAASFAMTIQTAKPAASLRRPERLGGVALALILLPFARQLRRRSRKLRPLLMLCFAFTGLIAAAGLTGCGTNAGFFGQAQQTYTINVYATATGTGGATLQHVTTVTLTVE